MKITNSWTVPQTVDGPEALKHFEMIWLQHIMMILIGHLRWSSRMILCRTENIQQLWRHIKDLRRWNYISSVLQRMEKQLISSSWARARDSRFRKISFQLGWWRTIKRWTSLSHSCKAWRFIWHLLRWFDFAKLWCSYWGCSQWGNIAIVCDGCWGKRAIGKNLWYNWGSSCLW